MNKPRNRIDTTFLLRRKILSELEKMSQESHITDKEINVWKNKWIKKEKTLFLNTLLFAAHKLAFPLAKEKKKGWIITRTFELLNDPQVPQLILQYLKNTKISIPILIVMDPVFDYYNAHDKIESFIETIPKSKTLEAGKNIARLLLNGKSKSRFEFLIFLNEFSFASIEENKKVLKNLTALKDVNLLNLFEFLVESGQPELIKVIIELTESIKHPESVLFLEDIIKKFKKNPEISKLAQEIKQKILESPELGKDKTVRSKVVFTPLTPFDEVYITPIQNNFTFTLHFINYKKNTYIILYCDLIIGIADFEILENVSKEQLKEFYSSEAQEVPLLPVDNNYAIKIVEDAYNISSNFDITPFFFFGLKRLLSKRSLKPRKYNVNWEYINSAIKEYERKEKPEKLSVMSIEEKESLISRILTSSYAEQWYYFTKRAKEMFIYIMDSIKKFRQGEITKEECDNRIFSICALFAEKYILPDIELWAIAIQRTIELMIKQSEIEKAFALYELTKNFLKNYKKYFSLSDTDIVIKILQEAFFRGIIERSILLSGIATEDEEKYFEDDLFENLDSFNDFNDTE